MIEILQGSKVLLKFSTKRLIISYLIILVALLILLTRMIWLQIIQSKMLIHAGNLRSMRTKTIFSPRGIINDRFGRPLAINISTSSIYIDPIKIYKNGGIINSDIRWKLLAKKLAVSLKDIVKLVNNNLNLHFLYLIRCVDFNTGNYIKELKLPGVYVCEKLRRYYPSAQSSSHLIGFTNIDGQGIEGIEKSFNSSLTGYAGKRIIRKDLLGRVIESMPLTKIMSSHDLVLSIDKYLQFLVYKKLNSAVVLNRADSGTAVLVDINTGEILVMTNSPSYNPNNINHIPKKFIRNRAITDSFEPGSTIKPIVILAALKYGLINKNSIIRTSPFMINGHLIQDVNYHNKLSVTEILQKSSNVGVSRLALSMPFSILLKTYSSFGIGKTTNLGLVGESKGFYPHKRKWSQMDKAALSFGYGLMVTPLQLARIYTIIGNLGIYRPMSILKLNSPTIGYRVFPKKITKVVMHMMEKVAMPGGGGVKAAVRNYRIAVKTGTVKKLGINGRYINKYVAYTVGIAPVSSPKFVLVVIIDNPKAKVYYGGDVSAPIFSDIMSCVLRLTNTKPDSRYIYN